MTAIDGIAEPKGGWQTGAWYSGRQYWNGTLSSPGVINSQSNQQGAGQAVSPEVVAASNPAQGLPAGTNENYLAGLINTDKLGSTGDVTANLNQFQSDLFGNASKPEVKVPTMEELKGIVTPEGGAPAPLNRVEKFEDLRLSQGVAELETTLNDIKAQEDELNAQFRQQKTAERGKTVPMNVIEGRIGEEERTYLERQDYLGRQKSRVVDELNTKYNVINQYMNFYSLDYQDAVKKYDTEFQNNLAMYGIILDQEKLKVDQWYKDQAIATTNLQMYMNAITAGNLNYSSLSGDQKMMISKLEAQSGVPIGFVSNLQISPKDKILSFSEDKTQAMIMGDNGEFKVINTGLRKSGSGKLTEAEQNKAAQKEMSTFLSKQANDYGHVTGDTYTYARNKWVAETGSTPDKFDEIFRGYRDPYNPDQYAVYNKEGELVTRE